MKNETTAPQPKEPWVTPAFTVLSVNDETLGGIVTSLGFDFGSVS